MQRDLVVVILYGNIKLQKYKIANIIKLSLLGTILSSFIHRCRWVYGVYFYNFILVIDTTVQNNDEFSLHFKPIRLIFMNYSVLFPQILLFTCDLMMAW